MENQELIECVRKLKEHCSGIKLCCKCMFAKKGEGVHECTFYTDNPEQWKIPSRIKLTEDEKVVLSNLDGRLKWIACDKYGTIHIFNRKPYKRPDKDRWEYDFLTVPHSMDAFPNLFKWLSWEDKEPVYIPDLLEGE